MRRFLESLRPWAPLILRLMLATIFVYYGFHKVAGGMGDFTKKVTEEMHMPRWTAYFAAWSELAGGVLIGLGFLTRLAALACAGVMAVAVWKVKLHSGFSGGLEFPLLTFAACVSLLLSGAGRLSLDRKLFGGP